MAGINSSERFIQYRKFKLVLEPEKYLDSIRQKCFRDAPVSYTHLTLPTTILV